VNLHDENSKIFQDFENLILTLGLTPLISTLTHHKPGCKPTCIVNILCSSTDNSVCSGTMPTSLHVSLSAIITLYFTYFNHLWLSSMINHQRKYYQFYDYSCRNVGKYVDVLDKEIATHTVTRRFRPIFFSKFNDQLDMACKLDQPECSKRTAKNNPWITSGLAVSLKKDTFSLRCLEKGRERKCLYAAEDEQFNCDCSNCKNKIACHVEFRAHRKLTTHLINCAKGKYTLV
jgi:hypothetical protein